MVDRRTLEDNCGFTMNAISHRSKTVTRTDTGWPGLLKTSECYSDALFLHSTTNQNDRGPAPRDEGSSCDVGMLEHCQMKLHLELLLAPCPLAPVVVAEHAGQLAPRVTICPMARRRPDRSTVSEGMAETVIRGIMPVLTMGCCASELLIE